MKKILLSFLLLAFPLTAQIDNSQPCCSDPLSTCEPLQTKCSWWKTVCAYPWWRGYYITFFGGSNQKPAVHHSYEEFTVRSTYKPGYALTVALGAPIWIFRLEGEFGYRRNSFHRMKIEEYNVPLKGYFRTISGMANFYHDFRYLYLPVVPYLGIGLGYANTRAVRKQFQAATFNGNDKGFAWQVIVGLSCPVYRKVDLMVEYRLLDTHLDKDYNHTVGGGLRIWF